MMPPEFRRLLERYNQLGHMLPRDKDYLDEPARVADAMLVIAEMQKVDVQINDYLDRHGCK